MTSTSRPELWFGTSVPPGLMLGITLGAASGFVTGSFGNAAPFMVSIVAAAAGAIFGVVVGPLSAAAAVIATAALSRYTSPSRRLFVAVAASAAAATATAALLAVFARPYATINPWWYVAHFAVVFVVTAAAASSAVKTRPRPASGATR